jgi:hypothetical protein
VELMGSRLMISPASAQTRSIMALCSRTCFSEPTSTGSHGSQSNSAGFAMNRTSTDLSGFTTFSKPGAFVAKGAHPQKRFELTLVLVIHIDSPF